MTGVFTHVVDWPICIAPPSDSAVLAEPASGTLWKPI